MNEEPKQSREPVQDVPPRIPINPQSAAARPQPPPPSSANKTPARVVLRSAAGNAGPDPASSSQTSVMVLTPDGEADGKEASGTVDPAANTAAPTQATRPGQAPEGDHGQAPEDDQTDPETASTLAGPAHNEPAKSDDAGVIGSSSQTIHIDLPEEELEQAAAKAGGGGPATVRLKRPATVHIKRFAAGMAEAKAKEEGQPVPAAKPDDPKRTTSRIPLEAARTPDAGAPATVRIRPRSPAAVPSSVPRPGAHPIPDGPKPPSDAQVEASKRQTSRISLESALAGDAPTPSAAGTPKTIRLKRASEASTVRVRPPMPGVTPVSSSTAQPGAAAAPPDASRQTAELPAEELADTEGPITRRKTIKVKRPTSAQGIAAPQAAGAADEAAPTADAVLSMQAVAPQRENPLFPICAIAALLVGLVLVWVLAAQAFGRNASLTPLSSWPNGPTLAMPGRILPAR